MTPKEKADELHIGYWHLTNNSRVAKQCALVTVNEILKLDIRARNSIEPYEYWEEVKQEIEKL